MLYRPHLGIKEGKIIHTYIPLMLHPRRGS
jgi:hypothetical protein